MKSPAARRLLLGLLVLAALLRGALALSGGQRYFPDENRYLRCFIVLRHLERGEWRGAVDQFVGSPDHTGFVLAGLLPALVQRATLSALGMPETRASVDATAWLAALLLGCASVACIGLVAALALRAGASEREALLAAYLMACSTSMFSYTRHLVPYDAALALALWALWLGLGERPRFARSLLVGLAAGGAFLTYNGYWLLALTVLGLHAIYRVESTTERIRRAAGAAIGFAALPGLLTAISAAHRQPLYVRELMRFGETATQASFAEGWSLPWAYLWHAEHGVLLALLAGAAGVLWLALRKAESRQRGLLWLGSAVFIYAALVLLSNGFERIGVYGRLARSLVPFLCLASGWSATRLLARSPGTMAFLCVALGVQAAYNFWTPLRMRFPREVARELGDRFGALRHGTTVLVDTAPEERTPAGARYLLLNARLLYPVYGPLPEPAGRVLFRTPHPVQYLPYQYEGYVPLERALLRSADVSIRLVDTRPE